jgi:hypothetical protein
MNTQTIEQTLEALRSVDDTHQVELTLDASIYSPEAVRRGLEALEGLCHVSISPASSMRITLAPRDPHAARVTLAMSLTVLLQHAIQASSEP